MKHLISGLVAVVIAASASIAAAETPRYGQQKVVYHINYDGGEDDRAYLAAMRNIQNHINAVGAESMDIKVVLHGNGVGLLASAMDNDKVQSRVLNLRGQNAQFTVCNNTLVGRDISYEDDLFEVFEDDIVPSGVAELSHLQLEGYTYIKP